MKGKPEPECKEFRINRFGNARAGKAVLFIYPTATLATKIKDEESRREQN